MDTVTILTDEQKKHIIHLFANTDITKAELARQFNVSPRTIGRVISAALNAATFEEVEEDDVEELQPTYKFVCTPTTITISTVSESQSVTIEDTRFKEIFELVMNDKFSQESLHIAFNRLSKKVQIEKLTFGSIHVDVEEGVMVYTFPGSGEHVTFKPSLANRVISAAKQGTDSDDFVGLINFVERLAWNPDPRVVSNLYDFILAKDIKINRDGDVVCYKKVRGDFLDIYTATMDNSPGKLVRVQRSYVDDDPNQTCSAGLHVCSWSYLRHYGTGGSNVVVEVHVDPKDFVSIPYDYYETYEGEQVPAKARVCEYRVIQQVDYTEPSRFFEDDFEYEDLDCDDDW